MYNEKKWKKMEFKVNGQEENITKVFKSVTLNLKF